MTAHVHNQEMESVAEGFVYAVQSGPIEGPIKIGWALDVALRVSKLQTGSPEPLRLLAVWPGSRADEQRVHRRLRAHRLRGEWFRPADAVVFYIENHGDPAATKRAFAGTTLAAKHSPSCVRGEDSRFCAACFSQGGRGP